MAKWTLYDTTSTATIYCDAGELPACGTANFDPGVYHPPPPEPASIHRELKRYLPEYDFDEYGRLIPKTAKQKTVDEPRSLAKDYPGIIDVGLSDKGKRLGLEVRRDGIYTPSGTKLCDSKLIVR